MLIERLMASFARRYYETNPGFVAHLTHEKIAWLRTSYVATVTPLVVWLKDICRTFRLNRYDNYMLEHAEPKGATSVQLEHLADLIKSLGGDYNWMKDKEIEVRLKQPGGQFEIL